MLHSGPVSLRRRATKTSLYLLVLDITPIFFSKLWTQPKNKTLILRNPQPQSWWVFWTRRYISKNESSTMGLARTLRGLAENGWPRQALCGIRVLSSEKWQSILNNFLVRRKNSRYDWGELSLYFRAHQRQGDCLPDVKARVAFVLKPITFWTVQLLMVLDDAIFWLYTDTASKLMSECNAIIQQLGLREISGTLNESQRLFSRRLPRNQDWLLVFDNVEDLDLTRPYWPMPIGVNGWVMVRSRNPNILRSQLTKSKEIGCLSKEDGASSYSLSSLHTRQKSKRSRSWCLIG